LPVFNRMDSLPCDIGRESETCLTLLVEHPYGISVSAISTHEIESMACGGKPDTALYSNLIKPMVLTLTLTLTLTPTPQVLMTLCLTVSIV
jgi:hypothetical protein